MIFSINLLHNHLANLPVTHTNNVYALLRFVLWFTIQ